MIKTTSNGFSFNLFIDCLYLSLDIRRCSDIFSIFYWNEIKLIAILIKMLLYPELLFLFGQISFFFYSFDFSIQSFVSWFSCTLTVDLFSFTVQSSYNILNGINVKQKKNHWRTDMTVNDSVKCCAYFISYGYLPLLPTWFSSGKTLNWW